MGLWLLAHTARPCLKAGLAEAAVERGLRNASWWGCFPFTWLGRAVLTEKCYSLSSPANLGISQSEFLGNTP